MGFVCVRVYARTWYSQECVPRTCLPYTLQELEAKAKHQADLAQQAAASAAPAPTKRGPWLSVGLVVKVMSKQLEPHGYYKKKGVIDRVLDKGYVGEVAMIDSGDVVRVDQAQLETVIPQVSDTHTHTRARARVRLPRAPFSAQMGGRASAVRCKCGEGEGRGGVKDCISVCVLVCSATVRS